MSDDPDSDPLGDGSLGERPGDRPAGESADDDSTTESPGNLRRRIETLRAEVELLSAENTRLRAEYSRARGTEYRRTAAGFLALGLLAGAGAVLFPGTRDVLVALAGTGLFAALLVHYLAPEQFVPVTVGEGVYEAYGRSTEALIADLGLQETAVYVPVGDDVRAFVPQHATYEVPEAGALERAVVVTDEERSRGLSLYPTGAALSGEFERAVAGEPARDPPELADQLADAIVEVFELTEATTVDVDRDGGRCSVGIVGSVYGRAEGFDHPVGSLLASGLARGLAVPVELDVETPDDDRLDHLVTCTWDAEAARSEDGEKR